MALQVGEMAPDFELPAVTGEGKHIFRLSDYRGKKNVVLAFYPLDWTPTCTAQMSSYNPDLEKFAALDAQLAGISVDSQFCHIAWQQKGIGMLGFPLCSDFHPHGAVAKKYGVFREGAPIPGINDRAVFVVDKSGKIVFSQVYELGQQPDNEEALAALRKL
jgi:peroxiredoxin